jgi:mono/diheme cytochrome c family protein
VTAGRAERGAARTWVIAFVVAAGLGLGAFVGIGCLVGANACPGSPPPRQTATDGPTLFLANCAACHGRAGEGGRAPSLVSGGLARLSEDELADRIARGKPLAGMPRFRRVLTPEQIRAVAAHVVALREGTASPAPTASATPAASPTGGRS